MIAGLRGVVEARLGDSVLLAVGGVVFRVFVPARALGQLHVGEPAALYTHLDLHEDTVALYGFTTEADRHMFEQLIGVSGVGPRLALRLLSALSADDLARAVADENTGALALVPGVGKRIAGRLVLELKGKLASPAGAAPAPASLDGQVVAALVAMGFSATEAQAALREVAPPREMAIEEALRACLVALGRRGRGG